MNDFKPKLYRLLRPELFSLEKKGKLYLAEETPAGYVVKLGGSDRIGLPKFIVEKATKLFSPYSKEAHQRARKFSKRPRITLIKKQPQHYV